MTDLRPLVPASARRTPPSRFDTASLALIRRYQRRLALLAALERSAGEGK